MSGILLAPGPVATHKAVKSLSGVFNLAVTKTKFETAAKQLESCNLGRLISVPGRGKVVFVKKNVEEALLVLQLSQNADLCTVGEYKMRYDLPVPSYNLAPKVLQSLLQMGLGLDPSQFVAQQNDSSAVPAAEDQQDSPQQQSPVTVSPEWWEAVQKFDT